MLLLAARDQLGERLAGIVLNAVTPDEVETFSATLCLNWSRWGWPSLG